MIILTAQDVDMERDARGHREGVENVWEHLCRQVTNFLALDA